MKKLIYAAIFTLMFASSVPDAHATGSQSDLKVSHIVHNDAHPNNAQIPYATHHFEVHVQGPALSELLIDLPEGVSISKEIEVKNQLNQKIDALFSVNNRTVTVVFSQPVPPETTLSINMRDVKTPGYSKTWMYHVYGKMVGINTKIPLGFARIQTYGR